MPGFTAEQALRSTDSTYRGQSPPNAAPAEAQVVTELNFFFPDGYICCHYPGYCWQCRQIRDLPV